MALLRPNYIFEKPESDGREDVENVIQKINPQLRQCFEVKTKIEPFYTGGKFAVLSPTHFACQCGTTVKVVSTSKVVKKENEDVVEGEKDGENVEEEEKEDDKKKITNDGFQVLHSYECEMDEILTFDAISNVLLTAHKSNLLRLWDLEGIRKPGNEADKIIKSYHSTPINQLCIQVQKTALSTVSGDENTFNDLRWASLAGSVVKIWETAGSHVSKALKVDTIALLGFMKWGPGPKPQLFVAERKVYIIEQVPDTKQFEVVYTCEGHFSQVTGIEWCDNENLMITAGRDNVMMLWDVKNSFNRIKTIQLPGSVESLILTTPSDLYLAFSPSFIRYFHIPTQKLSTVSVLDLGQDEVILSFYPPSTSAYTPEEDFWISTSSSSVYNVSVNKTDSPQLQITKQYVGSLDEILAVALWTDMKVAVANNTSIIRVYNLENGSCKFLRGHTDIVLSLGVQKNWLVSGSKDNRVLIWSTESDMPQFTLAGHIASVTTVCFDPLRMMVYSASEDTFIKCWDQSKCIQSVVAHNKEIHSIHCSPTGSMLLSASRDKTAKLWDADTLTLIGTLSGHKKSVWDAKFSSWDQLIVTASADTTLKIWNMPAFTCIKTLQGHQSSVLQAMFINSGLQVLSTSSDGTLKSWDLRTSICISTYEQSDDKIWALDAVPDGSLVVTGSADSVLTVSIDITEERHKENVEKKNKQIEEEQRLNNMLRNGEWQHAIQLAIQLDRPFTLLKIIREIPDIEDLTEVISTLPHDDKAQLMRYIKRWNTNSKTSTEAQLLLNIFFHTMPPEELDFVDIASILPFTQRHFQRLQKNAQHVRIVKFLADKD